MLTVRDASPIPRRGGLMDATKISIYQIHAEPEDFTKCEEIAEKLNSLPAVPVDHFESYLNSTALTWVMN